VVLDAGEELFAASKRALRYGLVACDHKDLVAEGKQ
jgi:hypothetical protein